MTSIPIRLAPIDLWGVYSVLRRHAKVYQNTWLVNFLPPISEPIIYLIAFGYGLTPLVGEVNYFGKTISYLEFIGPGMIAVGVLFQSFFEGAYGSYFRLSYQKTWHALLTAPLSFTEVFLGDWLWSMTKGTIAGLITGIITVLWGIYPFWCLVLSLPLIMLGGLLFGALGLVAAGSVRTVDQINIPVFMLIVPMFTLCGVYFPRDNLPPVLKTIANFLPLASLVDLLRWPIALPPGWPLTLLGMGGWIAILVTLGWRQIYPQLFR